MLNVIGLGYPRTGTMSLKFALEGLQLGPCYHMIEVFSRPSDVSFWMSALETQGEGTDWSTIFAEFPATTDCPACHFWRPLAKCFPDAKYILTVRDSEAWYDSCLETVYQAMTHPEHAPDDAHRSVQHMARTLILDTMFAGRFLDREFAIQTYEQHNQQVIAAFPASQLLVLNVADGWQPLCEFLKLPVPEQPFPQSNTRAEFQQRFAVAPPSE